MRIEPITRCMPSVSGVKKVESRKLYSLLQKKKYRGLVFHCIILKCTRVHCLDCASRVVDGTAFDWYFLRHKNSTSSHARLFLKVHECMLSIEVLSPKREIAPPCALVEFNES